METTRSFSSSTLGSIFASATRILPLEKGAPPPSRLPREPAGRGAARPPLDSPANPRGVGPPAPLSTPPRTRGAWGRPPLDSAKPAFAKTPGRRREPRRRAPSLVRGTYTRHDRTPLGRSPALSPCPPGARPRAWRRRCCRRPAGARGAQRQRDRSPLDLRAVADAHDIELALKAILHPGAHVRDQRPREPVQRADLPVVAAA